MTKGRNVYEKIRPVADAALFFDDVCMYWATGFYSTDGVVIVDREATKLCVDSRYYEAACNAKESGALFDDVEVILLDKGVVDAVKTHAKGETYAVDSELVTVARLERLKKAFEGKTVVTQENICKDLRMIKSPDELEKIKTAQAITDAAFGHITRFIRKGLTEKRIAAELEFFVKSNGGDNMSFDTICVSGPNSSLPHGVPGDVEICENSFLTMDFGVKYKGYCSDVTRTVVLGKATDEMKHVYGTVLEAQLAGIAAAKGGINGSAIDAAARDIIKAAGYGRYFGHGLGHSVGIEIHEDPRFSPKYEKNVPAGSLMTVEPGIYLPGRFGVRIEDMVYVTENGCEVLTNSPKNLIEL